jgi:hypothetical protein
MKRSLIVLLALAPLGCPEAPSDLAGSNAMDPGAAGGLGDGGQPLGPAIQMPKDEPSITQESLADDPDAVTLSGTLVCENGGGPFRIRLFVPPPEEGGPAETEAVPAPPGPLVLVEIAEPGPFSLRAPKNAALKVLAYEDLDKSGSATPDEAQFSTADRATVDLTADVTGLTLDCSKALPSPAPIQAPMPGIEGAAPPDDPEAAPATEGPPAPPPGPGNAPSAGDAPPAPPPGDIAPGDVPPQETDPAGE